MIPRRAFSLGATAGMALFGALFLAGTHSVLQLADTPDPDTAQVIERFSTKIYLTYTRVGLVHLWVGLVMGGVCGLILRWLYPATSRRPWLFTVAAFGLLVAVAFACTVRLMVLQPTFFDQFLANQGRWGTPLQYLLTDHVGLRTVHVLTATGVGLFLLGSRVFRNLVPRGLPRTRDQRMFSLVVATLGVGFLLRHFWSPPLPEQPDRPHILLLAVDSLRPDHMSFEGYQRETTPNLDRLAGESRVFRQAFVPLARTLPSWTTFLTSTEPHTHGIRHMFPDSSRRRLPVPTLPEVLGQQGYRTGVVSDFAGEMFDLVDYQFDLVDTPPASAVDVVIQRQMLLHFPLVFPFINHSLGKRFLPVIKFLTINSDASSLADRALRRFRELADDGPVFLTVFFSTSHAPYAAPYPWYRRFTDADYEGPHKYACDVRDPRQFVEGAVEYSAEDRAQITALYDGAVASVDAAIGEILEELELWEFMDSTLIIVTADHGEHLFEYGNDMDHGKWFRGGNRANQVPLLIRDPQRELGVGPVDARVRTLELMPTLLGHLGIAVPPDCEGVDLSPALRNGDHLEDLDLFAETGVWLKAPTTFRDEPEALIYPPINEMLDADVVDNTLILADPFDERVVEAKHRMVRVGNWKLVMEPTRQGLREHLFDLERDPGCQVDVKGQHPEMLAELRVRLDQWMRQDGLRRFDRRGHLVPYATDRE